MYRILVPVDFSETSLNALQYAIDCYKSVDLEITVLHIYGVQSTALMMKSIDNILIRDAKEQLSKILKKYQTEAPQVVFKTSLHKSHAVSTISKMGNSENYDLIIMGTKGATGLNDVFLGSVAGGVISKTNAPVIVVPLDSQFSTLNNLVFALGDDYSADPSTLDPLKQLLRMHKNELNILHISNDDTPEFSNVLNEFNDYDAKIIHEEGNGNLNEQINTFIEDQNTDLLCLLRKKEDFFTRFFDGSTTLKQTFNSPIPLMVLHE